MCILTHCAVVSDLNKKANCPIIQLFCGLWWIGWPACCAWSVYGLQSMSYC